ncbi:MAG: four helix bundle protein [Agriterribacter sp.]
MNAPVIKFEDLIAWQKAQDLAVEIYSSFKQINDYSFKGQICSAAVSVSNNIAEGFDSRSKKEFIRFLNISRNSCNEVKSMCYLAERLLYINKEKMNELVLLCGQVTKIIVGLSRSVEKQLSA